MFVRTSESGEAKVYLTSFQADTDSDIADLPTDCAIGSDCIVVSSGKLQCLTSDRTWVELGSGE